MNCSICYEEGRTSIATSKVGIKNIHYCLCDNCYRRYVSTKEEQEYVQNEIRNSFNGS